jgi:hypothetical protein
MMAAQAKLTEREAALVRALAELLPADVEPTIEALCDALVVPLFEARERFKERAARERERDEAARKARQMEYWRNCQRDHSHYEQCGPECATPYDGPLLNQRQVYDRWPDLHPNREARERMKRMRGG